MSPRLTFLVSALLAALAVFAAAPVRTDAQQHVTSAFGTAQVRYLKSCALTVNSVNVSTTSLYHGVEIGNLPVGAGTAYVLICNDGAVDIYCRLKDADDDVAAPGTSMDYNFTVKAGEKLSFDGSFQVLHIKAASSSCAVRVIAGYRS